MVPLSSFNDELLKIAKEEALYSAGVVAHEAGHAQTMKGKLWRTIRKYVPRAGSLYSGARLVHSVVGGPGISTGEFAAAASAQDVPVLADELAASVLGMSRAKKRLSKEDWKKAALQLAAIQSSYVAGPLVNLATVGAAEAGIHPIGQLGLQLVAKPWLGKALGAVGMKAGGPKVTATEAKKIVGAVAPTGTPVFATKKPIPGGSAYVPPADNWVDEELIGGTFEGALSKKDLKTIKQKGGVLLAPLDPKTQLLGQKERVRFKRL